MNRLRDHRVSLPTIPEFQLQNRHLNHRRQWVFLVRHRLVENLPSKISGHFSQWLWSKFSSCPAPWSNKAPRVTLNHLAAAIDSTNVGKYRRQRRRFSTSTLDLCQKLSGKCSKIGFMSEGSILDSNYLTFFNFEAMEWTLEAQIRSWSKSSRQSSSLHC